MPGTDTDERASPSQPELVALARRPREAKTLVELRPCSARVVAQEVDRLAHLGDAVDDRSAGFTHAIGEQLGHVVLIQICGAFEDPCPLARRGGIPICVYAIGNGESAIDILDRRGANLSDRLVPIRGIAHCVRSSTSFLPCDDRGALPS